MGFTVIAILMQQLCFLNRRILRISCFYWKVFFRFLFGEIRIWTGNQENISTPSPILFLMDFPLLILFDIKYKNRICTFKVHKNLNRVEDLDFLRVASRLLFLFKKIVDICFSLGKTF
jgi:hypothetical protein